MKNKEPKEKKKFAAQREAEAIQKKLGYYTAEKAIENWLDTGSAKLNSVLGSEELGLPYGKMIALDGKRSSGKTLIAQLITALAQADGADCGWADFENSHDERWAKKQGIDTDSLMMFRQDLIQEKNKKDPRLKTAEEVCEEIEIWMARRHKANPQGKMCLVIDSVTAMLVDEEAVAGFDQNMRTKVALATFLSELLRRWIALAFSYNALIVFINQVRTNPGQRFGDPEYSPGGNAIPFYCSILAKVRRVKNGRLMNKGKIVGLRGIIKNVKNKAGGGSLEGQECGFKAFYIKDDWRFTSVKSVKEEAQGGQDEE